MIKTVFVENIALGSSRVHVAGLWITLTMQVSGISHVSV